MTNSVRIVWWILMLASMALSANAGLPGWSTDSLYRVPTEETHRTVGVHATVPSAGSLTVLDVDGAGIVRHLWFTTSGGEYAMRGLVLKAYWDSEETPSVEAPLGDFCGVGFGQQRLVNSLAFGMTPNDRNESAGLNFYLPMPFRKHARIVLCNDTDRNLEAIYWHCDYAVVPSLPGDTTYFHARWSQSQPVQPQRWHEIMSAAGAGKYVVTVLSLDVHNAQSWIEGHDRFTIDSGQRKDSVLPPTGSEDYFGLAWGYRPVATSYCGASLYEKNRQVSAYRLHIPDPIEFHSSLKFEFVPRGFNVGRRCDEVCTVGMWYQSEPHTPWAFPPYEDRLPIEFARSMGNVFLVLRDIDEKMEAAVTLIDSAVKKWPNNPRVPDLLFRKADILERKTSLREAQDIYREITKRFPKSEATADANDKLWMLEAPGRAIVRGVSPSGCDIYLDGSLVLPRTLSQNWELPQSRVSLPPGDHTVAVRAYCNSKEPFEEVKMGYVMVVVDLPGPDLLTGAGWRVSKEAPSNFMHPSFDDSGWGTAIVRPDTYTDGAYYWLSGRGVRRYPGPPARLWASEPIMNNSPEYSEVTHLRKTFSVSESGLLK